MSTVALSSRRSIRVLAAMVMIVGLSGVLATQRSDAASSSRRLDGYMNNIRNFSGPGCPSFVCSTFEARGTFNGPGLVVVENFSDAFQPPEAVSRAHTVIHDVYGDVFCRELAIFDLGPGDHPFVDLCIITGGTGRYVGASGYIQEVGTFNFEQNLGNLHYHGKLILP